MKRGETLRGGQIFCLLGIILPVHAIQQGNPILGHPQNQNCPGHLDKGDRLFQPDGRTLKDL